MNNQILVKQLMERIVKNRFISSSEFVFRLRTLLYLVPFLFGFVLSLNVLGELFLGAFEHNPVERIAYILASSYIMTTICWSVIAYRSLASVPEGMTGDFTGYSLAYHYELSHKSPEGYVYLVRRLSDGIYKIGKSTNFKERFKGLIKEYGKVSTIALWEVPNCTECEDFALAITRLYHYPESGRNELRRMTDEECWEFISAFTQYMARLDNLEGAEPDLQITLFEEG